MLGAMTQLNDTGGREVALLTVVQPPKPPGLMLGEDLDDITLRQFQFIRPLGDIPVCHYHLVDTSHMNTY